MARKTETLEIDMEFSPIAGTPLTVSRVALGTWAIGGWMWGGTDETESISTIRAALDHGINVIDTAPVYGFGRFGGNRWQSSSPKTAAAIRPSSRPKSAWPGRTANHLPQRQQALGSSRRSRTRCAGCERTHRHLPSPLARPAGGDRGNRRCDAPAVSRREDPRHRGQQFFGRANAAVSQCGAAACAAVALQSVRTWDRRRPIALLHENKIARSAMARCVVGS